MDDEEQTDRVADSDPPTVTNEQYIRKMHGMFGGGGLYRADTSVDEIVRDTLRRAGIDPDTAEDHEPQRPYLGSKCALKSSTLAYRALIHW